MKATDQLRAEHEGIGTMLKVLNKIISQVASEPNSEIDHLRDVLEFLKVFVDRCHHGKEEDLLFPAMEAAGVPNKGGPIGQMLVEHAQGRELVAAMDEGLRAFQNHVPEADGQIREHGKSYCDLMSQHILKENSMLFPIADSLLSSQQQDELFDGFEKLEEDRIGKGMHEQYHLLLETLANLYLDDPGR
ncbi:MAG: hemerythrin domain-containing protein [Desulfomonilaceae bacterium]